MAVNDDAVFVPTTGHYWYHLTVNTVLPADLLAPGGSWIETGHTSIEDILNITSEGGEPTVLGTLQNKALRTTYSTRTETLAFTLQEFTEEALKLYFGSNATTITVGGHELVTVPINPVPTVCTFMAVFEDGANQFAFYAPKAEILRGDDFSMEDTESFAGLPLAVKPLQYSSNTWTYALTPLGGA